MAAPHRSSELKQPHTQPRSAAAALLLRDLRLLWRRPSDALVPLGFFVVAAALQPIAVGPEPALLRQIGPGVLWIAALLSALLPLPSLFAADHADGTLEQVLLSRLPLWLYALVRVGGHWLASGAPLVLLSPLLGVLYGLSAEAQGALAVGLLLGTPVLSLVGAVAAALTTGLRAAGALILLLVLPLLVPVLIFGSGAVQAVQGGQSPSAHLSLLGADLVLSLLAAPWLISQALRMSLE